MARSILVRMILPCLVALLIPAAAASSLAAQMSWYALGYRAESAGPYAVDLIHGLVYARRGRSVLRADVYRPFEASAPCPGVLLVHGGGWRHFDRTAAGGFARLLATHGFLAATVDYRSSKKDPWPACLYDVKAAVRWLRAEAARFNMDPRRIGAVGDSAGGHLVALLGTAGPEAGLEGEAGDPAGDSAVQAVVAYYGLFDLTAMPEISRRVGPIAGLLGAKYEERPELYRAASAISYVDRDDPPFLLVHGSSDRLVPAAQSQLMANALEAAGVPVRLLLVDRADHMLVKRGGRPDPPLAEVDRQVVAFLKERLGR
ncbi:MAG: alpha/beta hydrolase fold domain-containing protein [Bacteroidota bacterium]